MKKSTYRKIFINVITGLIFLTPLLASADASSTGATAIKITLENPIGSSTLTEFMTKILAGVVLIVTPFIVIMVIYSGFMFVKAQGNPGELEKAKGMLGWSLLGAAIILGAAGLSKVVENTIKHL